MLIGVGAVRHMSQLLGEQVAFRLGRKQPEWNILTAAKPLGDETGFAVELEAEEPWRSTEHGRSLGLPLRIRNTGRSYLTGGPFAHGVVTIGPYLPQPDGSRLELPRLHLPRAVGPGEELRVDISVPQHLVAGSDEIAVDLVREGIAWLGDLGSKPLVAPIAR
jgi:hypothetical protein